MNAGIGADKVARRVAATGVIGLVLILGGVIIAAVARWIDPPFPLTRTYSNQIGDYSTEHELTADGEDIFGRFSDIRVEDASAHFADAAIVAAFAALLALAVVWFIGRRKRGSYDGVGGLAVLLIFAPFGYLIVDLMGHHLPGLHTYIRYEYPHYPQWPLIMAAYGLVAVGILLVTGVAAVPESVRSLTRRALVLSVVAGTVVTGVAGTAAAGFGIDSVNIEQRTAAPADIPPTPDALGTQRYALTADELTPDGPPDNIVLAGTGFVVASESGLTAYDGATGEPRWHYRRENVHRDHPLAYSASSLRSLDGGTVVAAAWGTWGWKVFDAVTGELLRNDAEFGTTEDEERVLTTSGYRPGMVIYERNDALARYDARTNELLWSTEALLPGCVRSGLIPAAATSSAVFVVAGCPGEPGTMRIVAVDARTGAVMATRDVAHGIEYGDMKYGNIQLIDDDAIVEWSGDRPGKLVLGTPGDLAGALELDRYSGGPIAADPAGAEIFDGGTVLDTASGAVRATYPSADAPREVYATRADRMETAVFLNSELAELDSHGPDLAPRTLPRTTTDPPAVHPFTTPGHCGTATLLTAPGAVLVFCPRAPDNASAIFGFAP